MDEFNRRQFFQCHETLEELWKRAPEADRGFYQGVLQIAVGLLHAQRRNHRGALLSVERGIRRLGPYPHSYRGIDLHRLVTAAKDVAQALVRLGPERIAEFDEELIPTIASDPNAG